MRWKKEQLEKYVQAKEYIDTILLPVIPFQMGDDEESVKTSVQSELMNIFALEIERELTGRVMLAPSYYYLKTMSKEAEAARMNDWIEDMKQQPYKHIFLLTFDAGWKKHERQLDGSLLWLPAIQTGDMQSEELKGFVRDQTAQISEVIRTFWNE